MNFLADESLERQIVERLRQDGHSVQYVAEFSPGNLRIPQSLNGQPSEAFSYSQRIKTLANWYFASNIPIQG